MTTEIVKLSKVYMIPSIGSAFVRTCVIPSGAAFIRPHEINQFLGKQKSHHRLTPLSSLQKLPSLLPSILSDLLSAVTYVSLIGFLLFIWNVPQHLSYLLPPLHSVLPLYLAVRTGAIEVRSHAFVLQRSHGP